MVRGGGERDRDWGRERRKGWGEGDSEWRRQRERDGERKQEGWGREGEREGERLGERERMLMSALGSSVAAPSSHVPVACQPELASAVDSWLLGFWKIPYIVVSRAALGLYWS